MARITMGWPFGRYQPGDVVDVDQRIADVLVRECFARMSGEVPPPPPAQAPTLDDLRRYSADHGCTLIEARDRIAADRQATRSGPLAQPKTPEV